MPHSVPSVDPDLTPCTGEAAAAVQVSGPGPYTPPRLERLGPWQAVTLLYTVPIGPGGRLLPRPGDHTF